MSILAGGIMLALAGTLFAQPPPAAKGDKAAAEPAPVARPAAKSKLQMQMAIDKPLINLEQDDQKKRISLTIKKLLREGVLNSRTRPIIDEWIEWRLYRMTITEIPKPKVKRKLKPKPGPPMGLGPMPKDELKPLPYRSQLSAFNKTFLQEIRVAANPKFQRDPAAAKTFRKYVLDGVIAKSRDLFDNNFYVRLNVVMLLSQLNRVEGSRGIEAVAYAPVSVPLLDIMRDKDQTEPVKIAAVQGLKRILLIGKADKNQKNDIAVELMAQLGQRASMYWYPMRLAEALGIRRLRLKDDGRNASGSFKDRASSVGVARAMQEGFKTVACASTGNAASSLAYCAAAANLEANIFVSSIVPDGKLAQLLAYGARVFKIRGTYAEAYELCTRACERFGWYNRNAAINPYLVEGKKTAGLEIAEQCADDPPDWVAISVGDGCSIAGVAKGIAQMRQIGIINWAARMLGVQAAGVAPIVAAWAASRSLSTVRSSGGDTYADSINVPVPRNRRKALDAVQGSDGAFVEVSDEKIMLAVRETGRLSGVFAEPAAAAAVAGIAQARRQGVLSENSDVVAVITGNGLKDVQGAMRAVGKPHEIPPELDQVVQVVEADSQ
ncbi:MAG: threonine synthase [Planctomycetes bacterium]|nr:threonine synthase [Planctomycetota bacterium]